MSGYEVTMIKASRYCSHLLSYLDSACLDLICSAALAIGRHALEKSAERIKYFTYIQYAFMFKNTIEKLHVDVHNLWVIITHQ